VVPPQHVGFAARLISREIRGAQLEYAPEGLTCTLDLPLLVPVINGTEQSGMN
jgi:hypothetical protein